jgi:lipopolysaccharide transport system ATP-binding protein
MTDVAILVDGLAKKYRIRHQTQRYATLRDSISGKIASAVRAFTSDRASLPATHSAATLEDFWALKDVSFEVKRGEVMGIIGRNGAGKSTLLKILSRVTEPSEGRIELDGRVSSLLEVGTGFHAELTGRENIYLNGAILGMPKNEIRRKFDEIVDFAEVEEFLDTPVKRYSSGMYVRLAFAVAAHLEPDILIVDEVLAVGDAQFQKKCLGAIRDATRDRGRTVLFVSHNLSAVRSLCDQAIVLDGGRVAFDGATDEAISQYSQLSEKNAASRRPIDPAKPSIVRVDVDESAACLGHLVLKVEFSSPWKLDPVLIGAVVYNRHGAPVFGFNTWQNSVLSPTSASRGIATLRIMDLPIHSDIYSVAVFLGEKNQNYDIQENAAYFTFVSPVPLPGGLSPSIIGAMRVAGSWEIAAIE